MFSSSCVNTTARWISTVDSRSYPKALLADRLVRFRVNDTIEAMANQFLVDRWHKSINFTSYYDSCMPDECTYSYTDHDGAVRILTQIISFYGGLNVILRFLVPHLISAFRFVQRCKNRRTTTRVVAMNSPRPSIRTRVAETTAKIRRLVGTLNLFSVRLCKDDHSTTDLSSLSRTTLKTSRWAFEQRVST